MIQLSDIGNKEILGYNDPLGTRKSVTVSRYLLTVTLFGNIGFTKTVTVSRVSL